MYSRRLLSLDTLGRVGREHTKVSLGNCFTFCLLQVLVWAGKKKFSTTQVTNITTVNDDKLKEIPLVESEDLVEEVTVTVKEFLSIQHFNKFLKCPKCDKSIQQHTAKVVNCYRCGMIHADKCIHGMMVKVFLLKYNPIAAILTKTLYL